MLKGVNRQMIEVSRPHDPYFEKALLVVRSEAETVDQTALHSEAAKALLQVGSFSGLRRRRWRVRLIRTGWFLLGIGIGLAAGLGIGSLF